MRHNLLIVAVFVFLFGGSAFAQGAKVQEAKKDGWWIKVIAPTPQSPMMAYYAGATRNSYGFWRAWTPGNPPEFDVPEEFKGGPTFYILAQTTSGQKCRLCMMYKSKGIKYLEFDLETDYEAKQSEEDKQCN